jgi:thiol-disulfide isomerase/thioredoxin
MKKQFLLLFAIMVAMCSYGQTWKKGHLEKAPFKAQLTNRASIQPSEGQIWWGYMSESDLSKVDCIGVGQGNVPFLTGIYVPANHEQVGGSTIKAVRIYVYEGLGSTMKNVSVWISKKQPATLDAADYVQSVTSLADGANDIELTTPYAIDNQAFYIGYAVTSSNAYPIMCCGNEDVPNAFLICAPGKIEWQDLYGNGFGKLAFQILVDGATLNDYSATPSAFGTAYGIKGRDFILSTKVTNNGQQTINSLSYTVTTDGNVSEEKTVNTPAIAFNNAEYVEFNLGTDEEAAKYEKAITITKVNGQPNAAANPSVSGTLILLSEKPVHVPVVEEFTGTWCGWCPVGFEGMKWLHETYGDKVVLIAAHAGDIMELEDYAPILNMADGYPSSFINRMLAVYPHPSYFQYYMPLFMEDYVVPGGVEVTANWADDSQTTIQMNATTTFRYNDDNANYGVAFVLVEDGLTGTGSNWAQTNNLSHNSQYADMSFWYNSPSKVTGLEFDHVPVGAWGIASGMEQSVPTSFVADEALPFSYDADITSKGLIQDKSKLSVVALLIDKTNGAVINAAKTSITSDPSGISGVHNATATEAARYTLDGRQVSAPQRGLNIIRLSDGTVRKVIVK